MTEEKNTPVVEEKKTALVEPKKAAEKKTDADAFIARKLKVINEWPDGAKKRAAIDRLFRNKEA